MTNIIHPSFKHGTDFEIGNFCVIEEGVVVGDNVKIGNYVYLGKETKIGSNVFIDSYVKSSGQNEISDNVILRYNCTLAKKVFLGKKVFMSPNTMTIYSNPDGTLSKGIFIGEGSFIGTSSVIGPSISIASNVIVGAMTYVIKNCEVERGIYCGIPAKLVKVKSLD